MAWITRLRRMLGREKLAREQEEELEFHLSMREQWNVSHGLARDEGRRDAAIRFGNKSTWLERMSEIDLMLFPRTVLQDLRYGARLLARNIGFTLAAVLALSIGIGVNTAAFTAYKAFFKRPLDARDAGRMVNVALNPHSGNTIARFSFRDFEEYRNNAHALEGLIAVSVPQNLTLTGADGIASPRSNSAGTLIGRLGLLQFGKNAETASTLLVSDNYFSVLGMSPIRGRVFATKGSSNPDATPTAMISENYWQKRFGSDPSVLGKSVRLSNCRRMRVRLAPNDSRIANSL